MDSNRLKKTIKKMVDDAMGWFFFMLFCVWPGIIYILFDISVGQNVWVMPQKYLVVSIVWLVFLMVILMVIRHYNS